MIKRFYATKDNTITNAFEENLTTRGTGSNMGASDILEVFSIYAQASSTSSELARSLIEFDIGEISSSRVAGKIPASGSVSFYLKMFNAPHSQTVPSSFTLQVKGISATWEEGYGLDMDYYEDLTKDGVGSNWTNANGTFTSASFTMALQGGANKAAMSGQSFSLTDSDGTSQTFTFNIANDTVTNGTIGMSSDSNTTAIIDTIKAAINDSSLSTLDITASTITPSGDADSEMRLLIKQKTPGNAGNTAVDLSGVSHLSVLSSTTGFIGGSGKWATTGGDYHATPSFTQAFSTGLEDLTIDVSSLVEEWIKGSGAGGKDNYGFGIKLTDAHEAEAKSFFTKKFFGRDSEFHFQKPVLEARWDSARKDDRGYFYASSSIASATDNLNTLYLYNRIRGRLRDIPIAPTSASLRSTATGSDLYNASVTRESTGIYKADLFLNTTKTTLHDVWWVSGSSGITAYHTGTVDVKSFQSIGYNPEDTFVLSMPSLRDEYRKDQTHRLNLYVREKNWSPNIYTQAVRDSVQSLIIPSASFPLRRSIDDYVVVPYGTGSALLPAHTGLSYDVSGNYFDLDTTYLEAGYLYNVQYSFYDEENGWEEQPYKFKFRVVD